MKPLGKNKNDATSQTKKIMQSLKKKIPTKTKTNKDQPRPTTTKTNQDQQIPTPTNTYLKGDLMNMIFKRFFFDVVLLVTK